MDWASHRKQDVAAANLCVKVCFKTDASTTTSQVELLFENQGGKTSSVSVGFLLTSSQNPSYNELRNLENLEILHGQRRSLAITIPPDMFENVLAGREKLILEYQIRYLGPRRQLTEQEGQYEYVWEEKIWKGGDFGSEYFLHKQ